MSITASELNAAIDKLAAALDRHAIMTAAAQMTGDYYPEGDFEDRLYNSLKLAAEKMFELRGDTD